MSDLPDYFESDHFLLFAPTGRKSRMGGKTSLAAWWADGPARHADLVIFLNSKHDNLVDVLDDYREVETVDELGDAISSGARRIVLTPSNHDWEAVSRRLETFIRRSPSDMSKVVFLDEIPELDEDAVLSFLRVHGNGSNCQTIGMAQSPTDVDGSTFKQCTPIWVGPVTSAYRAWFRTHDFSWHYDYLRENHDPYHWSVLLGPSEGEIEHFEPVPARYGEV